MKTLSVTLNFSGQYIADPYRIEMHKLIEIQKQSGMMRARSDKKKRECLETHLRMNGMTYEDYLVLEKKAREPFYKTAKGDIYIPTNNVIACLTNANDEAPSRLRIQNLRSALTPSDFIMNKRKPDGVWERFAVVKSGMGKQLSNQRGLRSNFFIEKATAKGTVNFDPEMVNPEAIKNLFDFAGRVVGIGSSRRMNRGRFTALIQ